MLDRTDFASWQIRLYCRGNDNGVNILKSIDEGPYILGTFRETLAESTEGTPQFGPERPRVYSDLNSNERDRIIDEKLCGGTEDFSSVAVSNALKRTLDRVCMDIRRFSVVGDMLFIPRRESMNSNRCCGNALVTMSAS
uniref:Retrovirus-related Pol polyprotein from transposon TNT 1-94 n=1 Tax=Tanacetum cinerariifolium TaxID=118510 RepID=A0A699JS63_TANCI|nr:retrovirus-related Pol polyprotein from transposon TNT 1-94 [Tanacetum cinerariifolium]